MNPLAGKPEAIDPLPGVAEHRAGQWGELGPRIGSALVLMSLAIASTISGGFFFDVFWLIASAGILWEWLRLVGDGKKLGRFGFGTVVLAGTVALVSVGLPLQGFLMLTLGAIALAVVSASTPKFMCGTGLLYAGALLSSIALLRHSQPFGKEAVFFLFAVVWGTDCMAYFGGRLVGGPKLAPRLSPSKTWSGFLIGILSGSLLGWAVSPPSRCVGCVVGLGLLLGAAAQAGDIFESFIKRHFHVKDSGSLIPGHGGLMDRLDGFIAASLVAALLGIGRAGADAAGVGLFQW